jgi:parallel beta-helix repeat protein
MAIIDVFPGSPTAIQDAVTSANEGDVIVVHKGVYVEAVEVPSHKNNIRLVSKHKHRAILNGNLSLIDAFILRDVAGVQIEGFTIKNYVATGIRILNGKSHRVLHNQISDIGGIVSPVGIWVINSVGNLILNNAIKRVKNSDFGAGIQIASGTGNWVVHNKVQHNDNYGISVVDSMHSAIVGNQISDNKGHGILITGSDNHLILNNNLLHNGGNGVNAQSMNNLIVDSKIKDNHENGLLFARNYNFAGYNEIKNNEQSGIQVSSDFNDIQANKIKRNEHNGVLIQPIQTANFVYENQLAHNQPHDIQDLGVDNNILQNKTN